MYVPELLTSLADPSEAKTIHEYTTEIMQEVKIFQYSWYNEIRYQKEGVGTIKG